jgi:hypothetical protein
MNQAAGYLSELFAPITFYNEERFIDFDENSAGAIGHAQQPPTRANEGIGERADTGPGPNASDGSSSIL